MQRFTDVVVPFGGGEKHTKNNKLYIFTFTSYKFIKCYLSCKDMSVV